MTRLSYGRKIESVKYCGIEELSCWGFAGSFFGPILEKGKKGKENCDLFFFFKKKKHKGEQARGREEGESMESCILESLPTYLFIFQARKNNI